MDVVSEKGKSYTKGLSVRNINWIPSEDDLKLEVNEWARIDQAVAVYADMRGSTLLSTAKTAGTLGKMYELFTGAWIRVLRSMKSGYIDIKGDGGFGLFYGKAGVVQALLAAVTFNTIIEKKLKVFASTLTDGDSLEWSLEAKVGIHLGSLLVKRVGERDTPTTQGNWLVWAGKPVNYASKLASLANPGQVLATDPVLATIRDTSLLFDHLIVSCGCTSGSKEELWKPLDPASDAVQVVRGSEVWALDSKWCDTHGDHYFDQVRGYLEKKGVEVGVDPL